tara:strand:- start:8629 stop:9177 length:549 start_codon:yes stop_codon:yes gene_type:complete
MANQKIELSDLPDDPTDAAIAIVQDAQDFARDEYLATGDDDAFHALEVTLRAEIRLDKTRDISTCESCHTPMLDADLVGRPVYEGTAILYYEWLCGSCYQKAIRKSFMTSSSIVKREIDLRGPSGNAFVLIGTARSLASQLGLDVQAMTDEMKAGDYEQLIEVFDRYFGDYVDLVRGEEEDE